MAMISGALVIGLTLGLLGSGGSILTVPVLVYVLGHDDKTAIAESLAIVGTIAFVGMMPYARRQQVDWRNVAFFGIPGMGGTFFGAWLSQWVSGPAQLVLFAVVMLLAAAMMFRRVPVAAADATRSASAHAAWKIVLEGLSVGVVTGLVGVGGGFLIVPALVLLGGLPMRLAVGTSLVVITLKSFSGFFKYLGVVSSLGGQIDWWTIGVFVVFGIAGSFAGNAFSQRINQQALRRVFAGFLVVMGLFVLGREVPQVMAAALQSEHSSSVAARVSAVGPSAVPVPVSLTGPDKARQRAGSPAAVESPVAEWRSVKRRAAVSDRVTVPGGDVFPAEKPVQTGTG